MDAEYTGARADRGGEQQPYGARSHGAMSRSQAWRRRVRVDVYGQRCQIGNPSTDDHAAGDN